LSTTTSFEQERVLSVFNYHEKLLVAKRMQDEMFQIKYSLEGGGSSSFVGEPFLCGTCLWSNAIGYVFKVHKIEGRGEARASRIIGELEKWGCHCV